jgi:methionine-gamma-lyase
MKSFFSHHGIGTLVNHVEAEAVDPHPHVQPIYMTSTFRFPDVETGREIVAAHPQGYYYTRISNPNLTTLWGKIAVLEGLELLRNRPEADAAGVVEGRVFASGMAAVSAVLLSCLDSGDTLVAQRNVYSNTFTWLSEAAPRLGIQVAWVNDPSPKGWEDAFARHPGARLAYAETPTNPTLTVIDLPHAAEIAHQHNAWLVVDNTFATPFCQRPLGLGADIVLHSTTKYLSGHGAIIGGAVVSRHVDYVRTRLQQILVLQGAVPSPFDAWLIDLGLRTFELRMMRHCENAQKVANWLAEHPKVSVVHYPGLESHPGHAIANQQMLAYGGMLSFELKGGFDAGEKLMNSVRVATLAVSLGNVDTLIQHPASMTHFKVPRQARLEAGISDGLVRLSVGIENADDLIEDLEYGLNQVA